MRFLCIYKPGKPEGTGPTEQEMAAMGKLIAEGYQEGWLLSTEGCLPSAMGARVRLSDGKITVTDGPFAETKELIAGFWIVECKSREEVVERFSHAPFDGGAVLEIREIRDVEDFGDIAPEVREHRARVGL